MYQEHAEMNNMNEMMQNRSLETWFSEKRKSNNRPGNDPKQITEFPEHNSVFVQMENRQIQNDQRKILRQDLVLLFDFRKFDK